MYRLCWCLLFVAMGNMGLPSKWIEMTHKFDNTTLSWPGSTTFKHTLVFQGKKPLFYYTSYDISASEHTGTHLDSPIHFAAGKWTTDQIPLDRLIGDAIVVDITAKASQNRDAQLTVADLEAWEKQNGRIPDGVILLVLKQAGLHGDAARWIVTNRDIKLFGIDTASVDYGQSKDFISHQTLFAKNIPALENVANLDKLPAKGATVYAAPQYITDGSGGPCR
ncbi:hypothetical protein QZH41_008868, partial [Actinostola sp. cb2023]